MESQQQLLVLITTLFHKTTSVLELCLNFDLNLTPIKTFMTASCMIVILLLTYFIHRQTNRLT